MYSTHHDHLLYKHDQPGSHRSSGVLPLPECSFCHQSPQKLPRPYRQVISHQRTCRNSGASSTFFFLRLRPGPRQPKFKRHGPGPRKVAGDPRVITGPAGQPGSHRSPQDLPDLPRALVINFGNCRCRVGHACTVFLDGNKDGRFDQLDDRSKVCPTLPLGGLEG